jgi:hypothetical protein
MKSLRVSLVIAILLLLSATTLRAQAATRIACKDGSQPKVGHFTCWGHGGVVTAPLARAKPAARKAAPKAASKATVKQAGKPIAKKKKAAKAQPRRSSKHAK